MRQDSDNYRVAEVGPPRRATWLDTEGTTWRRLCRCRRQLSRYGPASETWQRVGSYPERREGAISAAYGANQR